jgi:hypothetical protein
MASVTTNYGFDVPTSSDLVKNGATQIALLGQDLDTFLFRPFTRNGVINSGFQVWQRGTSRAVTSVNVYTADRWTANYTVLSPMTISRQATGDTTNLPFIQYCARVQRDSGGVGGTQKFYQNFESINSIPYAGKQVTFSFYARAGANYSAASSGLVANLYTGTGTDQNIATGALTGEANPINQTATLTTTWQRFSYTATLAATATQIALGFQYVAVGTAGAADYFEVTGVMLEVGNQASPYAPNASTFQGELAACQRYYWNSASGGYSAFDNLFFSGNVTNATAYYAFSRLPVTMRTAPTITLTSTNNLSFPATAGSVADLTPTGFYETRTANATASGAYFGSNIVASAEL